MSAASTPSDRASRPGPNGNNDGNNGDNDSGTPDAAAQRRVLHLVRTALPAGVVAPGDLVVYTGEAAAQAGPDALVWIPDVSDPETAPIAPHARTSRDLCELLFQADVVVVW